MIQAAERTKNFTYAIRNIVHEAKKIEALGREVLYLNIGDPAPYGFGPSEELVAALEKAIKDGHHGYAPSLGVWESRVAIAEDSLRQGIPLSPEDVIITSGASEAADLLLSSLMEPGDEWLVPTPGYPLYTAILSKLGAKEVAYHTSIENAWEPDLDEIERLITPKTKGIVVINPNNPTGAIYSQKTLEGILALSSRRGLLVLADEVYGPMTYGKTFIPMAKLADHKTPLITLESMSKVYLAPGWRVGWMKIHNSHLFKDLRVGMNKMADARLCSPRLPQHTIPTALALDPSYMKELMGKFQKKRDYCMERIRAIPAMKAVEPQGAFYLMAQIRSPKWETDEQFVLSLLREHGVLLVHGSGFGTDPKSGFFRMVYLPQEPILKKVFDCLENLIQ
jgi:alanine-synthesizing transaminase